MKALIFDGEVIQIEAQEFPVAPALTWVDLTGINPKPKVGWFYNGIVFLPPPPAPPLPPPPKTAPDSRQELWDILKAKGLVTDADL